MSKQKELASIWKKLNLKDESKILVHNAPESFEPQIKLLEEVTVSRSWRAKSMSFLLLFVTKQSKIASAAKKIVAQTEGDTTLWIAYPKKSSNNHSCDFDRDNGWEQLGKILL